MIKPTIARAVMTVTTLLKKLLSSITLARVNPAIPAGIHAIMILTASL